jgi:hypothetical protein
MRRPACPSRLRRINDVDCVQRNWTRASCSATNLQMLQL